MLAVVEFTYLLGLFWFFFSFSFTPPAVSVSCASIFPRNFHLPHSFFSSFCLMHPLGLGGNTTNLGNYPSLYCTPTSASEI